MKQLRTLVTLIVLFLAFACSASQAGDRIEIVQLQNRSAEELLPLIRPLLDADEALSGTGYQLIVRASDARQNEIRSLIAQLDQAARQLRISVRRAAHE